MDITEKLLIPAILGLATVIGYLWRRLERYAEENTEALANCEKDRTILFKQLCDAWAMVANLQSRLEMNNDEALRRSKQTMDQMRNDTK
jgi:hypothetical protein